MKTEKSEAALGRVEEFFDLIRARMKQGVREYGDASFDRPIPETLNELRQELLDQAGWAFINWVKLGNGAWYPREWHPALKAIYAERARIVSDKTSIAKHSTEKRAVILQEEAGEVARAVLRDEPVNLYNELAQVAAVALLWMEDLHDEMGG